MLRDSIRGKWSQRQQSYRINILELISIKLAILAFTKHKSNFHLHIQIGNKTALSYTGQYKESSSSLTPKEIWNFLTRIGITITTEYIASKLNVVVDWKFQNCLDSSDSKLDSLLFQSLTSKRFFPETPVYIMAQLTDPNIFSWKPDPAFLKIEALQNSLERAKVCIFVYFLYQAKYYPESGKKGAA